MLSAYLIGMAILFGFQIWLLLQNLFNYHFPTCSSEKLNFWYSVHNLSVSHCKSMEFSKFKREKDINMPDI